MQTLRDRVRRIVTLLLVAGIVSACSPAAKRSRVLQRADHYFQSGDYDKAKIEYLNLLRLDHQNVTAFQQLGFIWLEEGVPSRALPFLFKVRELAPKNVAGRAKLALALAGVGAFTEARKEAATILEQDPGNSEAIVILAEASRSKEEIAATEQQLQKFPQRNTAAFHLGAAILALRKGDAGATSDELQEAIALDPKSPRLHMALAYIYLMRRNPSRAGEEFKIASDLAPLRSNERIKYAEFQAANGSANDAKASLQKITQQVPDYLLAWRLLAQISFSQKNYDEAFSSLENVFSRDPDNPDARTLQSEIWLAKGDAGKAIAILDKLNNAYPNNALVKYQLARAYLASKNPGQATAALEQAIAAKPDYAEAILALGELNLRSGKPQAVVAAMEDLLKKRADLPQARLLLADAYEALGRLDDAAALFREQIKQAPQSPEAYLSLGLILRQQKKSDEARQAFEKSAQLAPDNLGPINQLVEMDLADQGYGAAMERVQQQLQKKPDAAGAHFLEGRVYAAQKDWPRAEAAFEKAIKLNPNFGAAHDLLVWVYVAANKLPEAARELEVILKANPNNVTALAQLAGVYQRTKDYPKASDSYERLIALKPDSATAANNLAVLYSEHLNRLDQAYELAQKAHTLQPGDGPIADTLGWILYKRGDYQQALALLQESAGKLPENPEVQFHLGMANYMMAQADAARAALEKATRATVDFPGKGEAQRRLAMLEESSSHTTQINAAGLEALLKQQPNDLIVLQSLAGAYEREGQAAKAAAAYEQVLRLNPKFAAAAIALAQLYAGPLQKRDKALEFAKKARELAPNDPQAASVLGHVAFQADNFGWAYSLLQESARQRSGDPAILHDLARTAYALGKVPEARLNMQRCLDSGPDAAIAEDGKRFLAMTALEQPSPEVIAAAPQVETILRTQPDYLPAMMAQAAIHLQENNVSAAANVYSEVLRKYPDFGPAQKRLAAIDAENPDDLTKAYDLAIKARKALPDDPELAITLAELSFKRKEFPYAIQLFQESARKRPLPAKDVYYLGVALLETRDETKGRETLKRALAGGLQDPLAQDAKHWLAERQPK